jgi:hypothetical protein
VAPATVLLSRTRIAAATAIPAAMFQAKARRGWLRLAGSGAALLSGGHAVVRMQPAGHAGHRAEMRV